MTHKLPLLIDSGEWTIGHCQGIALDKARGHMYFSFTTALIKTDLTGRVLGSVTGLLGHLGCIAFCQEDGKVYGSLEYKNDEIGEGILKNLGSSAKPATGFYIAVFDTARIDALELDASRDGAMRAAYLKEVYDDYTAPGHRFGCSGIDGLTFGPKFGAPADSKKYLTVAYGVYGDTARQDNDHQVLLMYDPDEINATARPLVQTAMHTSGPERPAEKLFLFTGNTCYGIQNLEYDPFTQGWLMAVYKGSKPQYPNYTLFVADGSIAPTVAPLRGCGTEGAQLALKQIGLKDESSGLRGYHFPDGSTGLCALGDGRYYISRHVKAAHGYQSLVRLYQWDEKTPFAPLT